MIYKNFKMDSLMRAELASLKYGTHCSPLNLTLRTSENGTFQTLQLTIISNALCSI